VIYSAAVVQVRTADLESASVVLVASAMPPPGFVDEIRVLVGLLLRGDLAPLAWRV